MKGQISPTLLCADPLNLGRTIQELNALNIAWYHVDVMDGHFVPNLAFGLQWLEAILRNAAHPVYSHFMTDNPEQYIAPSAQMGLDCFIFHLEAVKTPFRMVQQIKEKGMKVGIAVNPVTPISSLCPLLPFLDVVTIMAVEPGFSGQKFLEHSYGKIAELSQLRCGSSPVIEVDGGITPDNCRKCVSYGADVLVAGAFTLFRKEGSLQENFERTCMEMEDSE